MLEAGGELSLDPDYKDRGRGPFIELISSAIFHPGWFEESNNCLRAQSVRMMCGSFKVACAFYYVLAVRLRCCVAIVVFYHIIRCSL